MQPPIVQIVASNRSQALAEREQLLLYSLAGNKDWVEGYLGVTFIKKQFGYFRK